MDPSSTRYSADVEFQGARAVVDAAEFLEGVSADGAVSSVRLTVQSDGPIYHGTTASTGAATDESNNVSLDADQSGSDASDGGSPAPSPPTVRAGSDPYHVLTTLIGEGGWARSGDLRDRLNGTVNLDRLPSTLYALDDRGLLEKRPLTSDRRRREYRITDRGEDALAALDSGA